MGLNCDVASDNGNVMRLTSLLRNSLTTAVAICALGANTGCDADELFGLDSDGGGLVNVFSTHHASPTDEGEIPDRTAMPEFTTDEGWEVVVSDSILVTASVTLRKCGAGSTFDVDMYFGALPEDLTGTDLVVTGIGGVDVPKGEYCSVTVDYAPLTAELATDGGFEMPDSRIDGHTLLLEGTARKDGVTVPFEIVSAFASTVDVNLPVPLDVGKREAFAKELTVSKTYDRFFDGIDFERLDTLDLDTHFAQVLSNQTWAVAGTNPVPPPPR